MCFIISKKRPNSRIAKRKIKVYKTVVKVSSQIHLHLIRSEIWQHIYSEGLQPTVELKEVWCDWNKKKIQEGYHSYHLSRFELRTTIGSLFSYIICYIPKGAEYYYNPDLKEYISNQIEITFNEYGK